MTQSDLETLFSHPERQQPSVFSVYLNVDQSRSSNRNRGFEKQLKGMTSPIRDAIHDAAEMEKFVMAAHHIEDFVAAYEPAARGLILFFDSLDGFFWHQEVDHAVREGAKIEVVTGEASSALNSLGGIGAFLKPKIHLKIS
jgi:hypothetical protein